MLTKFKIAAGVPAYKSQLVSGHAKMWLGFGAAVERYRSVIENVGFVEMDVCGVDRARNFLLAYAMKMGASWLVMVDSDTWVDDGSSLLKMVIDANNRDAAIVGAPVFRRVENELRLNVLRRQGDGRLYALKPEELVASGVTKWTQSIPPIIEVDAIGAAVMAIDLRKIGDAEFKFTSELSEDLDFCQQIQNRGGRVFCDPRVVTNHMKTHVMRYG